MTKQLEKKFAVLGDPIVHSLSPEIHNLFSMQNNINLSYEKILVKKKLFKKKLIELKKAGYCGLNITLPLKEEAYKYALEQKNFNVSTRAKIAKSVNTYYFKSATTAFADNTDGVGFINSLLGNGLKIKDFKNFSILILGSGGASKGIIHPLLNLNPQRVYVANRTIEKLEDLKKQFKDYKLSFLNLSSLNNFSEKYNEINKKNLNFDLIINATSSSVSNKSKLIAPIFFNNCRLAIDLYYSDKPTLFMKYALDSGAHKVIDGLGMLVEQAAESYFIWTGFKPNTNPIHDFIRKKIKR